MKQLAVGKQNMTVLPQSNAMMEEPLSALAFAQRILARARITPGFYRPLQLIHKEDEQPQQKAPPSYQIDLHLTLPPEKAARASKESSPAPEKSTPDRNGVFVVEKLLREQKRLFQQVQHIENQYHISVRQTLTRQKNFCAGPKHRMEELAIRPAAEPTPPKELVFSKILRQNQQAGLTASPRAPLDRQAFPPKSPVLEHRSAAAEEKEAFEPTDMKALERQAKRLEEQLRTLEQEHPASAGSTASQEHRPASAVPPQTISRAKDLPRPPVSAEMAYRAAPPQIHPEQTGDGTADSHAGSSEIRRLSKQVAAVLEQSMGNTQPQGRSAGQKSETDGEAARRSGVSQIDSTAGTAQPVSAPMGEPSVQTAASTELAHRTQDAAMQPPEQVARKKDALEQAKPLGEDSHTNEKSAETFLRKNSRSSAKEGLTEYAEPMQSADAMQHSQKLPAQFNDSDPSKGTLPFAQQISPQKQNTAPARPPLDYVLSPEQTASQTEQQASSNRENAPLRVPQEPSSNGRNPLSQPDGRGKTFRQQPARAAQTTAGRESALPQKAQVEQERISGQLLSAQNAGAFTQTTPAEPAANRVLPMGGEQSAPAQPTAQTAQPFAQGQGDLSEPMPFAQQIPTQEKPESPTRVPLEYAAFTQESPAAETTRTQPANARAAHNAPAVEKQGNALEPADSETQNLPKQSRFSASPAVQTQPHTEKASVPQETALSQAENLQRTVSKAGKGLQEGSKESFQQEEQSEFVPFAQQIFPQETAESPTHVPLTYSAPTPENPADQTTVQGDFSAQRQTDSQEQIPFAQQIPTREKTEPLTRVPLEYGTNAPENPADKMTTQGQSSAPHRDGSHGQLPFAQQISQQGNVESLTHVPLTHTAPAPENLSAETIRTQPGNARAAHDVPAVEQQGNAPRSANPAAQNSRPTASIAAQTRPDAEKTPAPSRTESLQRAESRAGEGSQETFQREKQSEFMPFAQQIFPQGNAEILTRLPLEYAAPTPENPADQTAAQTQPSTQPQGDSHEQLPFAQQIPPQGNAEPQTRVSLTYSAPTPEQSTTQIEAQGEFSAQRQADSQQQLPFAQQIPPQESAVPPANVPLTYSAVSPDETEPSARRGASATDISREIPQNFPNRELPVTERAAAGSQNHARTGETRFTDSAAQTEAGRFAPGALAQRMAQQAQERTALLPELVHGHLPQENVPGADFRPKQTPFAAKAPDGKDIRFSAGAVTGKTAGLESAALTFASHLHGASPQDALPFAAMPGSAMQGYGMKPLTYGPAVPQPVQNRPAAPPPEPYRESSYVQSLPGWARDFLKESYAPTAPAQGQSPASAAAAPPAYPPQKSAAADYPPYRAFQSQKGAQPQTSWSAPGYAGPAPRMTHRKKPQETAETPPARFTDAEIRRMANQVYGLLEERLKRDRRRMGL